MLVLLHAGAAILFFLGSVQANDPLEGNFFTLDCMKERTITGCTNETLLSAYKKTEASKSDENGNEAGIQALLWTRDNKEKPEFLHRCGGMLPENTNYRRGKGTIFFVGGYMSPICGLAVFKEIIYQLLCRDDYNVIHISWNCCNGVDYFSAARNTKVVGKMTAFLIEKITNQTGESLETFHCIGHSLGAQICGFIGQYLQLWGKGKLRRITALDPAGPSFLYVGPDDRLDRSDAKMVDVIHSSAAYCTPLGLGSPRDIGHAEFYPNGGTKQPSCYLSLLIALLKGDVYYAFFLLLGPFCPHFESLQYFKVSINACKCQFVGVECTREKYFEGECKSCGTNGSRCAVMGMDWESCQPNTEGRSYYLNTQLLCPYCNNDKINLQGFSTTPPQCGKKLYCFEPGRSTCQVGN